MLEQLRDIAPWFALWVFALYMTLLGYVWNAQGEPILALLSVIAALGAITSLIARAVQRDA